MVNSEIAGRGLADQIEVCFITPIDSHSIRPSAATDSQGPSKHTFRIGAPFRVLGCYGYLRPAANLTAVKVHRNRVRCRAGLVKGVKLLDRQVIATTE